ncbi:hypothetical protein D0Y65_039901 [Glycine soja]|uniref:Protein FAR1-RELATED SEQUENCE n=1 Tax=Glycine soja TaxID=3848 RepID=A0A445GP00_GLYSO|nr:hypothetical protein D0Y65_039901 [Glycine soja]
MNHVHLFPAYRGLMDVDKAQADSLCRYGVKTCHIMGYIVGQKGGYDALGFTREDLYNYFDSLIHAQIKDGDIVASLSYLDEMPDTDPMLYGKFTTTTNDETTETYKWVLKAFLEAMGNKHLKVVVTDGNGATREAIRKPYTRFSPRRHLKIFGLRSLRSMDLWGNKWVSKTYENRSSWVAAYFRDRLCKVAAKKKVDYNEVMEDILKLTIKYEKLGEHASTQNSSSKCFCDPTMIKTKGAPKKRDSCKKRSRHCSNCNSTKHNARMCPQCDGTNDKSKGKEKVSDKEKFNRKHKKAKKMTQNSDHPMISPTQPMVQPKVPPMQIPTYVNSNQGPFSLPNYGGVPVFPHNTQVLILSQVPQDYHGQSVGNNYTSYFGLLQEVVKNVPPSPSLSHPDHGMKWRGASLGRFIDTEGFVATESLLGSAAIGGAW